jgi:modulator of FtsH protease
MYDQSYSQIAATPGTAARTTVLGQVLGLLGFSFVFTAAGAWLGTVLAPGAFVPALIVSFGALIALLLVRERAPLNLGLLYLFATAEGVTLGIVLQSFLARGLGSLVTEAAGITAAMTLAAAGYGATTRRDLSRLGGLLFVALIGVIVAAVVGLFIHEPLLNLAISLVAALLFTGFLVYDVNRVATAAATSQGDAILLAVAIYLDIYNLFLNLLNILLALSGNSRD